MVRNPFIYGEPVRGEGFTDRVRERELIASELALGRNVLLTAPPHFGKSSLANKVLSEFERQGVLTLFIDLERAFSPDRWAEVFLSELMRTAFRQPRDLKNFLETLGLNVAGRLSLGTDAAGQDTIIFNRFEQTLPLITDLLDILPSIVEHKKRHCVLACDEITENAPADLLEVLRRAARQQTQVGYLMVNRDPGTRKDREGFLHLPLGKIEDRYLKALIKTRFENTGFRIEEKLIDQVLDLAEGHAHYVQLLCRELWNLGHGSKSISVKSLPLALESVLEAHTGDYAARWRVLSPHQKKLLIALNVGGGAKIFSKAYLERHHLGNFSSVQKSLRRLLTQQIIERDGRNYRLQDLFFRQWLQRRMS